MRPAKQIPAHTLELTAPEGCEKLDCGSKFERIDWRVFIDSDMLNTLQRMWQLQQYASQNGYEVTQLAIPYSDFVQWGHDLTQLRVLIVEGILVHLNEVALSRNGERRVVPKDSLAINSRSCFLLSHTWQSRLGPWFSDNNHSVTSHAGGQRCKPVWDLHLRKLTFQDRLIKHFRCPAQNQEAILCAFQEEGWPERICDPLPPIEACESKQRLHDAIRGLNRNQASRLLRFGGDGTGEGVVWVVESATPRLPTDLHHSDT